MREDGAVVNGSAVSEGAAVRVGFVLGTSAGGVGRHVRMLARGMTERGVTVVVAGPAATEEAFGFAAAGARFTAVEIADRPRPGADLRAVARLRRVLAGAGVVHAHGLRAGALAALARAGRRQRLVVTLHNAPTAGGAVAAVYGLLERIVAARADLVLVVSPDLGERMRARGARGVAPAVVPAPAPAPSGRDPREVRDALGAGDRPVALTVARLAQQKGLDTLLAAAGHERRPLWAVAGEGPLRADLERGIAAGDLPVRLLGDRGDVPDLLGAADVVVVPSRWEGQPLIVQEALRAGRPLVAADVGGIPGMVGEAALLVPAGDPGALAGAVARVLDDEALRARLAAESARRGAALPGEDDAVDAALAAYAETGA
ncbi:glycosyltransferase family 4 protein [Bailinhaonella thermotolerans]|uniref:Glycosyltransferase family 1 protein n=1 Tax=Bailinhaonella thermotolerans TaxID=1070861 RepID=A0A3A4A158_9ACTN|nr:glycosyltransferase family 4 protein [Bailinhaonella thermotolerans]RJL20710.1 glycosyltransferase family 1 protein [Bailinhaonella thermotolerans]